jgi:hypothetical protein
MTSTGPINRLIAAAARSLLALVLAAWCLASGVLAADNAAPANPLSGGASNPLTGGQDPFVGTFQSGDLTIRLHPAGEGKLQGTLEQNGKTYALTAARLTGKIKGAFTHDGNAFPLVITLEDGTLNLYSGDRLFVLTRVRGGGTEVVTPSLPPLTLTVPDGPAPSTVRTPPTAAPPKPAPTPSPPQPQPQPATPSPPPAAAGPPMRADRGRAWAGMPRGAFAVFEDNTMIGGRLPAVTRIVLTYQGTEGGHEMVQRLHFENGQWRADKSLPWLEGTKTPAQMGYVAGKTSKQILTVDGAALPCDVTEYEREIERNGRKGNVRMELWTADVDLPPQTFLFSDGLMLMESGVVRLVVPAQEFSPVEVDLALTSLKQTFAIGQQVVPVAQFKGAESSLTPEGKVNTTHERLLSPAVPGGMARFYIERRRGSERLMTVTETVLDFGPSITERGVIR